MLWLLVMACSDGEDTNTTPASTTLAVLQDFGSVAVCLSSSAGQSPRLPDTAVETDTWHVSGTLVDKDTPDWGTFNLIECGATPQRAFEVQDDAGDSWYLGFTLTDVDGGYKGLDPDLTKDSAVTVTVVRHSSGPAAFALIDAAGLAFVVDAETVTQRMGADALPGLTVGWGIDYGGAVSGDCAQQASQLVLTGDGTAELYAGDEDGLSVGGQAFHVRAFAVYRDPGDPTCQASHAFVMYR